MNNDKEVIPTCYNAGVDALVFTMPRDGQDAEFTRHLWRLHIEDEAALGMDMKASGQSGFQGIRAGSVFYGERERFNLFEAKGGRADEIAREIRAARVTPKVTRIDFQVTYPRQGNTDAHNRRLQRAFSAAIAGPERAIPQHVKSYQNRNGANSYYLHTAAADSLFRSYNKAAESPMEVAQDAWRGEAQFRHQRAKGAWQAFRNAADSTWLARSYVAGFMLQLGLHEPWMEDSTPCAPPSRLTKSDTAKRLEWFLATALPVARKLVDGGVSAESLLTALRGVVEGTGQPVRKSLLKPRAIDEAAYLEGLGTWLRLGDSKSAQA